MQSNVPAGCELTMLQIGSSRELKEQLEEQPSNSQRRLLAELQRSLGPGVHAQNLHIFGIDGREQVQMTWKKLQGRCSPGSSITQHDCRKLDIPFSESYQLRKKETQSPQISRVHLKNGSSEIGSKNERVQGLYNAIQVQSQDPQGTLNVANGVVLNASIHDDGNKSAAARLGNTIKVPEVRRNSDTERDFLAASLTLEGQRQAQVAGEKFRARGPHSHPKKSSTGSANRQSYHNRWASYKSNDGPNSFGASRTSKSTCRVRHALSNGSTVDRFSATKRRRPNSR